MVDSDLEDTIKKEANMFKKHEKWKCIGTVVGTLAIGTGVSCLFAAVTNNAKELIDYYKFGQNLNLPNIFFYYFIAGIDIAFGYSLIKRG